MEKPEIMKVLNELNASINRMWILFSVVAKTEHKEATIAYLEEKERASKLLAGLGGGVSLIE
jgi:hypothetical protein